MNRGRILQSLNTNTSRASPSEQRRDDPVDPPCRPVEQPPSRTPAVPVSALRGRGGRILSQLASSSARQPSSGNDESSVDQSTGQQPVSRSAQPQLRPQPPQQTQAPSQPTRRPVSRSGSSCSDTESSGAHQLVRRDSTASGSSAISQQFIPVDQTNYKADLPKNPSTAGAPVKLSLNYMTFETSDGTSIEEYHVDFQPNIESIRLRYMILRSETAVGLIGNVMHWTGTNLYLPIRLPNRVTEFNAVHPINQEPLRVRLTFVKTPPDSELMPFYNSLMHKAMNRLRFVIINRQHYSPMHKIAIEQYKIEVWPGWITAIQRLDGGIKLSVDASFRVLRLETVRDVLMEIRNRCRAGSNIKEAFESELIGTIIMTRYNNRAYRVDGIDLTRKPTDTFTMTRDGGREISYVDYMRNHWNVEVRDVNQPLLIHKPKPKRGETESETVYLIPELCVTTGLTDDMRTNFSIMKAIGDHTRLPPDVRETKLQEFLLTLSSDEGASRVFSDWGLKVNTRLDVVTGRRLDSETVIFGNNHSVRVPENVDWTRPATSSGLFKSVDIESWVIIYLERDENIAKDFMNNIKEISRVLCIRFCPPRIVKLQNDSPQSYVNAGKREVKQTDQMVVILTPGKSQREDRYSACKRLFSCDLPVPCQFIRCGTISNPRKIRAICQKILIQIASKVGGQPWAMKFPMKSFMVVGIDVYHDTIDRKKSCVGFVCSMNHTTSRWWTKTFFQNSLEEIGQKVNANLVIALKRFHALNGFVPQKIIVYRDGVGDGQLEAVLDCEVSQAVGAVKFYMRDCQQDQAESPHLSYVIVQKRINAKLSLRESGRCVNPLPGTYLDHTITHPEYNDFYLVSQHVNQGTVNPTKYIVLTETGNLKLEHHQKLAYKLTHMYYNWCGTIRVPAPCQYAHKVAYLTGQNIRQEASDRLEDKLYYL